MQFETTLCLVRHGETDWNLRQLTQGSTDVPLNDNGRMQAQATARALAGDRWDAVISSPLARAQQTAQLIAEELRIPAVEREEGLVERSYGAAEGTGLSERKRLFPNKRIPGAESWEAVEVRAFAALERIVRRHAGKRVIVVSHGGTITRILHRISDGEIDRQTIRPQNASMHLIAHNGSWKVLWYNGTAESSGAASLR